MAVKKVPVDKTQYLIVRKNGERFKITIPSAWKVTWGHAVPGKTFNEFALRVWESETKQRALFQDVVHFRDLSIPVEPVDDDPNMEEPVGASINVKKKKAHVPEGVSDEFLPF